MIGTGTAIALGLLGAASTASQVYSTKKSGDLNEQSLNAQKTNDAATLQLQREQLAQERQLADEKMAFTRQRYADYQKAWQPIWSTAPNVLGSLLDVARGAGGGGRVAAPATASAGGPTPTGVNWTDSPDQLTSQINGYFTGAGKPTTETPYWVDKASELVARGKELNDPEYANKRLMAAEAFGGGGQAPAGQRPTSMLPSSLLQLASGNTNGSLLRPASNLGRSFASTVAPSLNASVLPGMSLLDLITAGSRRPQPTAAGA